MRDQYKPMMEANAEAEDKKVTACRVEPAPPHNVKPATRKEIRCVYTSTPCSECNVKFVFTKREQEYYDTKGFTNIPTRCKVSIIHPL